MESSGARRSARKRGLSLKAELNESFNVKVAVTPLKTPGKKRGRGKAEESEVVEEESPTDQKCRNEEEGKSSSACAASEEVKGQGSDSEIELPEELLEEEESGRVLPTDGYWVHYKSLCEELPGREKQVELLLTLLGKERSFVPPSVYIYGITSTGKTYTVQKLMRTLKLPCAFVNCIECYCSRLLYETILNRLKEFRKDGTPKKLHFSDFTRCDNLVTFLEELKEVIESRDWSDRTIFIVLDRAERLREMEFNVLPAMLQLSYLSGCRVCVMMISVITFERLSTDLCPLDPLPIHFPAYTKAETLTIMEMDLKSFGRPRPFCQTYVNHIWNVFQSASRDLSELRHLSTLLFPKYCEPVDKGEIGEQEVRKLWRHIQPYFKGVMGRIFLREVSSSQFEEASANSDISSTSAAVEGVDSYIELPYFSKYLLMAAYMASYNPAKTDKRYFSKPNYHKLGPKTFPLDRMMAIFYSILEENEPPSVHIYSQVSTLVTLQLLSEENSQDRLDSPKYKCLATLDFIRQVAKTVNFDIIHYLEDFN